MDIIDVGPHGWGPPNGTPVIVPKVHCSREGFFCISQILLSHILVYRGVRSSSFGGYSKKKKGGFSSRGLGGVGGRRFSPMYGGFGIGDGVDRMRGNLFFARFLSGGGRMMVNSKKVQ